MSVFRIIDQDGKWICSAGLFPITDPETKTRFNPGEVVKVKVGAKSWLAGQMEAGSFVQATDPMAAPPKAAAPPATAPAKPG